MSFYLVFRSPATLSITAQRVLVRNAQRPLEIEWLDFRKAIAASSATGEIAEPLPRWQFDNISEKAMSFTRVQPPRTMFFIGG
jgi:hypothetical protein